MYEILEDFIATETKQPLEKVAERRGITPEVLSGQLAPMRQMKRESVVQKTILLAQAGISPMVSETRMAEIRKAMQGVGNVIATTESSTAIVNLAKNQIVLPMKASEVGAMRLMGMLGEPVGTDVIRYSLKSVVKRERSSAKVHQKFDLIQQLVRRKWLTKAESNMAHELHMAWEVHIAGGGLPEEEDFECFDQPIVRAYMALPSEVRKCLYLTCIKDMGIEQTETDLGWPARSGKLVLRIGLRELAAASEA